ncbi:hypothetical protein ACSMDK_09585 [Yersinia enterocolitica]|uniref:hypothetical protein n=1 Tax=Yersinia TaxID=629 RepID=UPI003AB2A4B9
MLVPNELVVDAYPSYSWMFIQFKDYLGPNRYLQDAIDDLKSGQERRNFNNAIRNAKSALHMKVDILCRSFCGDAYFKLSLKNFPQKLDFLESIGIVRPRIIDKINKLRNKIEHEYRDATLEEAEDFIDIVLLFIEATKYLNSRFPSDLDFQPPILFDEGYLSKITCKWSIGELVFNLTDNESYNHLKIQKHIIKVGDKRYNQWLKYIIDNND